MCVIQIAAEILGSRLFFDYKAWRNLAKALFYYFIIPVGQSQTAMN